MSAAAGIHATAAAVAYFFRSSSSLSSPPSSSSDPVAHSSDSDNTKTNDGATSKCRDRSNNHCLGGKSSSGSSPIRALTLIDCPSLPPLAVLEAIGVENGAGLEHIALGFSRTPLSLSPSLPPPKKKPSGPPKSPPQHRWVGAVWRELSGREEGGLGSGAARKIGEERDDEDVVVERTINVVKGGGVAVSSETLKSLYVSGEKALTGIALRCPRLKRVELVRCPDLG